MRRINRCLNKQLLDMCQRSIQLDDLKLKLDQYIPQNLKGKCQVGSFTKGCLLIQTSHQEWATELRYYLPTLRDTLRKEAGLYQLISIKIQIHAEQYEKPVISKPRKTPKLSLSARDTVKNAGELCSYSPLKEVLLRLARRNKEQITLLGEES